MIVIKQLPVIEDQLQAVKASIEDRVKVAMALVCTEETYKDVKKVRADLNKEFQELEKRRKEVKAQIMAPYDSFEKVYRECAAEIYTRADAELRKKIAEVENGLKSQKEATLAEYFAEYRESVGLKPEFVTLEDAKIKVGLSDNLTGLKKRVAEFLDHISADLQAIENDPNRDEILPEYQKSFDLAGAMLTVHRRHQENEAARKAREEAAALAEAEKARIAEMQAAAEAERQAEAAKQAEQIQPAEALTAPVVMDGPIDAPQAPEIYTTTFTVSGTMEQLKALKRFLMEGGYDYV